MNCKYTNGFYCSLDNKKCTPKYFYYDLIRESYDCFEVEDKEVIIP